MKCNYNFKAVLLLAIGFLLTSCSQIPDLYLASTTTPEEPAAFHAEIVESAWSQVDEKYFDSTFNGRDWFALGEKYRGSAINSPDRVSLYRVINTMFTELGGSHLQAIPPEQAQQVG